MEAQNEAIACHMNIAAKFLKLATLMWQFMFQLIHLRSYIAIWIIDISPDAGEY